LFGFTLEFLMLMQTTLTQKKSPIVELVGLAGTGKTTLLEALSQHHPQIRSGVRLPKMSWVSAGIQTSPFWLPTLIRQVFPSQRGFNSFELRSMVYLQAWYWQLEQVPRPENWVTVFDHGPIFRLALLREFEPQIVHSDRFEQWWNAMLEQWTTTLDLIIYLEAPNDILLERIQKREHQKHTVKGQSQEYAYNFLARYRRTYQQILDRLMAESRLEVLRCNTHEESVAQSIDRILAALDTRKT
jgi:deoxyadenosine/deoxycytidine kinase